MRRVMVIGLAALAMGALGACGDASIGEPQGSTNGSGEDTVLGLLIDEHSDSVTRGRFITTDTQISFFTTSSGDDRVTRVEINGKIFDVTVDGSVVTVDGHGAVLTATEKAALLNFSEAVTSRFQAEATGAARLEGLANMTAYLSEAPEGYVHRRLVNGKALPEGVAAAPAASGIVCLTAGQTYSVPYSVLSSATFSTATTGSTVCKTTALRGKNVCQSLAPYVTGTGVDSKNRPVCLVAKPVVAGSDWGTSVCGGGNYGCMGRCGAGCSTIFGTKLTLDCLRHDTCSHDKAASGAGADTSCGDEYGEASDDAGGSCPKTP